MSLLEFIQLDLPPLLMLILTSVVCATAGNYVILTKRSLMSDTLVHSVLPGIVIGFLVGGTLTSFWIPLGAAISGFVAILLVEFFLKSLPVESNAVSGAVFSTMFALGIVLLELFVGTRVHLDVEHVLFGGLEQIIWLEVGAVEDLFVLSTWQSFPIEIVQSLLWLLVFFGLMTWFGKAIELVMFDREHAALQGYYPDLMHLLLMLSLILTVVFAFQAVGSVLVVALLICPGALMRLYCRSVREQVIGSGLFAVLLSILGYSLGVFVPMYLGFDATFSVTGIVGSLSFFCFIAGAMLSERKKRLA